MRGVANQGVEADGGFDPDEWNDAEAWLSGIDFATGNIRQDDDVQDDGDYQGGFDDNYEYKHNEELARQRLGQRSWGRLPSRQADGYGPWRDVEERRY